MADTLSSAQHFQKPQCSEFDTKSTGTAYTEKPAATFHLLNAIDSNMLEMLNLTIARLEAIKGHSIVIPFTSFAPKVWNSLTLSH